MVLILWKPIFFIRASMRQKHLKILLGVCSFLFICRFQGPSVLIFNMRSYIKMDKIRYEMSASRNSELSVNTLTFISCRDRATSLQVMTPIVQAESYSFPSLFCNISICGDAGLPQVAVSSFIIIIIIIIIIIWFIFLHFPNNMLLQFLI